MEMSHPSLERALAAVSRSLELAVVLPTYNERANVEALIDRLGSNLRR